MDTNIKTYPIGSGEITLTAQDAEELRVMLQTEYLERTISELIDENAEHFHFDRRSARRHLTEDLVRMNDDLINYDSSCIEENLAENLFRRADHYKVLR